VLDGQVSSPIPERAAHRYLLLDYYALWRGLLIGGLKPGFDGCLSKEPTYGQCFPRARQLVRDIEGAAQIGLVGGGVLNTTTGG